MRRRDCNYVAPWNCIRGRAVKVLRIHGFTEIGVSCIWNWKSPLKKGFLQSWLMHYLNCKCYQLGHFNLGMGDFFVLQHKQSCPAPIPYIRNSCFIHCNMIGLQIFSQTLLGRNSYFIQCNNRALIFSKRYWDEIQDIVMEGRFVSKITTQTFQQSNNYV